MLKASLIKRKRNKEWAIKAVRESVSLSETEALKNKVIDLDCTRPENPHALPLTAGRSKLLQAGASLK